MVSSSRSGGGNQRPDPPTKRIFILTTKDANYELISLYRRKLVSSEGLRVRDSRPFFSSNP